VRGLRLSVPADRPLRLLCLGAHADDLEIGCGATVMTLAEHYPGLECTWVVLSATAERAAEARAGSAAILAGAGASTVIIEEFRDAHFPAEWPAIKARFEGLKTAPAPDLIFTHHRGDRHQDHQVVANLTWNTWRDHLILEYEVPKYEGDLHTPGLYVPIERALVARKVEILRSSYASQQGRSWFDEETFRGLMRIRGVECASPTGYAEGFHAPKLVLS